MRTVAPNSLVRPRLIRQGRIITCGDPDVFGCATLVADTSSTSSGGWFTANKPIGVPFVLNDAAVVTHLGWRNGSSPGSQHDMGIYDENWKRICSTGSTGGSGGANVWQWIDITDTPIPPGRYYLVKVLDSTAVNRVRHWGPADIKYMGMMGVTESATDSVPLPDPLVGMTAPISITRLPVLGFAVKAPL